VNHDKKQGSDELVARAGLQLEEDMVKSKYRDTRIGEQIGEENLLLT
jgi:hypothetical protein